MSFIRKIKKKNVVYLAEVENYREVKKVRQKVIRYIGKELEREVVRRIDSKCFIRFLMNSKSPISA